MLPADMPLLTLYYPYSCLLASLMRLPNPTAPANPITQTPSPQSCMLPLLPLTTDPRTPCSGHLRAPLEPWSVQTVVGVRPCMKIQNCIGLIDIFRFHVFLLEVRIKLDSKHAQVLPRTKQALACLRGALQLMRSYFVRY